MATTTTKGYPYPEGTDPVDVPGDIQALAEAVDDSPGIESLTSTEIAGLSAGAKWAGRVVWNSTAGKLQVSNGSTFSDVDTSVALSSSTPQALGTAGAGTSSDASRADHRHAMPSASDVGAIANALLNNAGKGSLASTTGSAVTALAPGSNGQALVADSAATLGLRYIDPPSGRNLLINSQLSVWQRGSTFTNISADGTYTADRWFTARGGNLNVTRRSLGSHNPPAGFNDYAECLNKTASNAFISFEQALETSTCIPLRGREVTISFYARAAANTDKSKSVTVDLVSTTSTDTKTGGSTVGSSLTASLSFGTASTDWQRFSFTRTVPTDCGTARVRFVQSPSGGLAVDDGFHITGVQLEVGPVATPFEFEPYEATLRKCQRYYYKHVGGDSKFVGLAFAQSAALAYAGVDFPVTMRTTPSLVATSGTDYYEFLNNGVTDYFNSLTIDIAHENAAGIYNASEIASTINYPGRFVTRNASSSIAFSAEL